MRQGNSLPFDGFQLRTLQGLHVQELSTNPLRSSQFGELIEIKTVQKKPAFIDFHIRDSHLCSLILLSGTMMTSSTGRDHWSPMSANSVLVANAGAELKVQISRGPIKFYVATWPKEGTEILSNWVSSRLTKGGVAHGLSSVQTGTPLANSLSRFVDAIGHPEDIAVPELTGIYHEFFAQILVSPTPFSITQISGALPPPLATLVERVRVAPEQRWALKEAAERAGYSPFHLSRTFRSLVGYGFPEFVDRCRTEMAIQLVARENPGIDELSRRCGFGTTQALRDSFRSFLGLLPSEVKSLRLAP